MKRPLDDFLAKSDEEEETPLWGFLISAGITFLIMWACIAGIVYVISWPYCHHQLIWKWSGIFAAVSMWRAFYNYFFKKK